MVSLKNPNKKTLSDNMVKIIDHDKKNTAILICEKLERNNYIQKFEINEKKWKIYLWVNHWEVQIEELIELFNQKNIKARKPSVDRTGYSLILDIGKENKISLKDCFII